MALFRRTLSQRVARRLRRQGHKVLGRGLTGWASQYPEIYKTRLRLTREGHWPGFVSPADTVVAHITVTFDSGTLIGNFKTDMRTIERIGVERFGSGVSYNWVIDMKTGMIGMGQELEAKGTHTVNDKNVPNYSHDQNLKARAIAFLGVPGDRLYPAAKAAWIELLFSMWKKGAITDEFDFEPHSVFAYKDCPTDAVRDAMPEVYAAVRARIEHAKRKQTKKVN